MKRLHVISFLLLFTILIAGCSKPASPDPISKSDMFFDTVISISLLDSTDESILNGCMKLCQGFEDKFSRTIANSEISQINAAEGAPITVSAETIKLIQKGLDYSELSGGVFDITIAPLSDLWDFKNNKGTLPLEVDIQEALRHVDYRGVVISGNTVTLKDPKASIDLGGIAKGYIADELKEYLEGKGVRHALINLGGNVLAVGNKPDKTNFNIGIQKPFDAQNTPITSVSINDQSTVSSGVYERYFKLDGTVYHHILDPSNGYPYDNNLLGVTIISNKSVDGDALSTTCFALGLEEGMNLIHSLENTEAIFVTDDYKLHYSDGLKK